MLGLWHRFLAGQERGMAMIYVVILTPLMAIVTTGVIMGVAADSGGGIRTLQAARALAVADAGLNHAMATLQGAGGESYTGQSNLLIQDGTTTIGTANIAVTCPTTGTTPPCIGADGPRRKVSSTGTLPGGVASRTVVAILEGVPGTGEWAVCSGQEFEVNGNRIFGNAGSNGSMKLTAAVNPQVTAHGGTPGNARSGGSMSCSPAPCSLHATGTVASNLGPGVCPTFSMPSMPTIAQVDTYSDLSVAGGGQFNMNNGSGWNFKQIQLNNGAYNSGTGTCSSYTDLRIHTGTAGNKVTIKAKKLVMGTCSRIVLIGDGKAEFQIAEHGMGLTMAENAQIGVKISGGFGPQVVSRTPASRINIYLNTNNGVTGVVKGIEVKNGSMISAHVQMPGGEITTLSGTYATNLYGSFLVGQADLQGGGNHNVYFEAGAGSGSGAFVGFDKLRSYKDQ